MWCRKRRTRARAVAVSGDRREATKETTARERRRETNQNGTREQ